VSDEINQFKLRIPEELAAEIRQAAGNNGRSASDLIDDRAANETVAGEGSRPLHEVMHRALTDARKLREQLSRPL